MQNSSAIYESISTNQNPRFASVSKSATVFTDIYREEINLAIWQNELTKDVIKDIKELMGDEVPVRSVITAKPAHIAEQLIQDSLYLADKKDLCQYIELLADMFCTLFELNRVGLRLTTLSRAMCPRFHVDKVPCRLVTTLSGKATEWLTHETVDRSKLGKGSNGLSDDSSGVIKDPRAIQQLTAGDVALLKGEGWYGNTNGAIVHRSPATSSTPKRLLLTLDFMD